MVRPVVLAVGCATTPRADTTTPKIDAVMAKVANQAAFDLQCPKDNLETQKLSDDTAMMGVHNATYGVRGCGKQACDNRLGHPRVQVSGGCVHAALL
jgi:hypothetical protein